MLRDSNVLVLCGRKKSGKTSLSNYINGYVLRQNKVIKNFGLTEDGKLVVNAFWVDEQGVNVEGEGILDLDNRDESHIKYFIENVWPHVKTFSFKEIKYNISKSLFDLEKDTRTKFIWNDMFRFMPPMEVKDIKEKGRQNKKIPYDNFIEILDHEIFRVIDKNYIVNSLIRQIKHEYPGLSIVLDCKNLDDLNLIKTAFKNTKTIWVESELSKKELPKTEKNIEALSSYDFDLRIKNNDFDLLYTNLVEWGFINQHHTKVEIQENTSKIYREE